MTARADAWVSPLIPGDGDPRHGYNGYSNLKCRCDICRAANVAYCLARRAHRRARPLPDGVEHGTYNTYTNYGCRCAECKRANADYCADYQRRRAAKSEAS